MTHRLTAPALILGALALAGCAAWEAFVGALAPAAGQAAASSLAGAVADARARGVLPADPAVERLEKRLAELEAAERRTCPAAVDAGTPLSLRDVEAALDRAAGERLAAAAERAALRDELRALLAPRLPSGPVLPVVHIDAGAVDASADGAP